MTKAFLSLIGLIFIFMSYYENKKDWKLKLKPIFIFWKKNK